MNEKDQTPNQLRAKDDFYALATEQVDITLRGKTRTFTVKELSEEDASRVFDIQDRKGQRDPEKAKNVRAKIIAACVSDQYGQIDFDTAKKMSNQLANKLQSAALDVNGFGDPDLPPAEAGVELENA